MARGGRVGRNIGAIALDGIAATVGAMVTSKKADESLGKTFDADHQARMAANPLLNAASNAASQPMIYGQADGNQLVGDANFRISTELDNLPANYMAAMNAYGGQAGNLPTVIVNANKQIGISDRDMTAMAAQMNSGVDLSRPMTSQEFLASAVAGDNAAPGPWQQHLRQNMSAAEIAVFERGSELMQAQANSPGVVAYRQEMAAQHAEQQAILANVAGEVSTQSGRVAAAATAYAGYFAATDNPYGEGAAAIQLGIATTATLVGLGAGAVQQALSPHGTNYLYGNVVDFGVGMANDKLPLAAPLFNEAGEKFKASNISTQMESWINNKWDYIVNPKKDGK